MAPCIQYAGAWNKRTVRNHMGEQVDLTANDGVGVPFVGSKMYVHRSSFEHTYSTGIATGRYKFSGRCNRPVGAAEEDYDCTMDMDGTGPRGVPNGQEFSGNTFFNTTTGAGAIASSGQRFKIYNNLVILVHDRRADYMKLIGSCGLRVTVAKPGRNPLPGQMRLAYFRDNVVAGAKFRGIIVPGFPCEWLDTEQEQLVEDFGPNYAHHCAIGLLVKGGAQKPGRNLVPGGDGHPSDHWSTRSPAEAYAPQPISGTNTYCSAVQNQVSYENRAYGFVIPCGGGRAYWIRDMYLVADKLNAAFWQTNGNAKAFKLGQRDAHVRFYRSTVVGTGNDCYSTGVGASSFYGDGEPFRPNQIGDSPGALGGTVIEDVVFKNFNECRKTFGLTRPDEFGRRYPFAVPNPQPGRNFALLSTSDAGSYSLSWHDNVLAIETKGLTFSNTVDGKSKVRFDLVAFGTAMGDRVSDRTCAQIGCDGDRNTIFIDRDGSLNPYRDGPNSGPATLIPMAELDWNRNLKYKDPESRYTVKELLPRAFRWIYGDRTQTLPMVDSEIYDFAGLNHQGCILHEPGPPVHPEKPPKQNPPDLSELYNTETGMPFYVCPGGMHRHIIFESNDKDTMARRIAPVAVRAWGEQGFKKGKRYTLA